MTRKLVGSGLVNIARLLFGRLFLLLFGFGVAVGASEILLRTLSYSGARERLNTVFDAKFGTVMKKSWIFSFDIDPAVQSEVEIYSIKIPVKPAPNDQRILFIGDSATAGARIPRHKGFVFEFKSILDIEHPSNNVEVINAGVWGMTTIDEYHLLKDKLLPLEPDVVVLGLFMSNDINFNLGHEEQWAAYDTDSRSFEFLNQRSALVHFLALRAMDLNNRYKLIRSEDFLKRKWIPRKLSLVDSYGFHMLNYPAGETATYMREPSDLIRHGFDVLDQVLQQFLELGSEFGFEFRVLLIPSPSTVAGELTLLHFLPDSYAEIRKQGIAVEPEELDFDRPTRRVLEICRNLQIVCLDPTQRMKEVGLAAFFPKDEHPSILGHRALAQELVENHALLVGGPR